LLYVRVHGVSTGPVSGDRLNDRRPRRRYLPGPCVVAGARNHLRADRSLAFRFEVTA